MRTSTFLEFDQDKIDIDQGSGHYKNPTTMHPKGKVQQPKIKNAVRVFLLNLALVHDNSYQEEENQEHKHHTPFDQFKAKHEAPTRRKTVVTDSSLNQRMSTKIGKDLGDTKYELRRKYDGPDASKRPPDGSDQRLILGTQNVVRLDSRNAVPNQKCGDNVDNVGQDVEVGCSKAL